MRAKTATAKKMVYCVRVYDLVTFIKSRFRYLFFCLCLFSVCYLISLLLNVCQTMSGKMTVFNNRGFDLFFTSFSSHSSICVGMVSTEFRFRYFDESEAFFIRQFKVVEKFDFFYVDMNNLKLAQAGTMYL